MSGATELPVPSKTPSNYDRTVDMITGNSYSVFKKGATFQMPTLRPLKNIEHVVNKGSKLFLTFNYQKD